MKKKQQAEYAHRFARHGGVYGKLSAEARSLVVRADAVAKRVVIEAVCNQRNALKLLD